VREPPFVKALSERAAANRTVVIDTDTYRFDLSPARPIAIWLAVPASEMVETVRGLHLLRPVARRPTSEADPIPFGAQAHGRFGSRSPHKP